MLDFTNTESFKNFKDITVEPNGLPNELVVSFYTDTYDVKLIANVRTKDYSVYDYAGDLPFEDISDDVDLLVEAVLLLQNKVV